MDLLSPNLGSRMHVTEHIVLTVHGIRTFGHWQERLEMLTNKDEVKFVHYSYGYLSLLAFLIPISRWFVTRRFRRYLLALSRETPFKRLDIVAHSFGSHLVAWGLKGIARQERPKIHTIIFSGSVLKSTFSWQELTPAFASSVRRRRFANCNGVKRHDSQNMEGRHRTGTGDSCWPSRLNRKGAV